MLAASPQFPRKAALPADRGDLATCLAMRRSLAEELSHWPHRHTPSAPQQVFTAQIFPLERTTAAQSPSVLQGVRAVQAAFWPQNPAPRASVKQKQFELLGLQFSKPFSHVWPVQVALVQEPASQAPDGHTLPQAPQFFGSDRVFAAQIGVAVTVAVERSVTVTVVRCDLSDLPVFEIW